MLQCNTLFFIYLFYRDILLSNIVDKCGFHLYTALQQSSEHKKPGNGFRVLRVSSRKASRLSRTLPPELRGALFNIS